MQRHWTQFAATGDPNAPELAPAWPRFGPQANVRVSFGVTTSLLSDFRARECAFWRDQYDRAFGNY